MSGRRTAGSPPGVGSENGRVAPGRWVALSSRLLSASPFLSFPPLLPFPSPPSPSFLSPLLFRARRPLRGRRKNLGVLGHGRRCWVDPTLPNRGCRVAGRQGLPRVSGALVEDRGCWVSRRQGRPRALGDPTPRTPSPLAQCCSDRLQIWAVPSGGANPAAVRVGCRSEAMRKVLGRRTAGSPPGVGSPSPVRLCSVVWRCVEGLGVVCERSGRGGGGR